MYCIILPNEGMAPNLLQTLPSLLLLPPTLPNGLTDVTNSRVDSVTTCSDGDPAYRLLSTEALRPTGTRFYNIILIIVSCLRSSQNTQRYHQ